MSAQIIDLADYRPAPTLKELERDYERALATFMREPHPFTAAHAIACYFRFSTALVAQGGVA